MGLLVDGVWQDRWYDTASSGGRFQRDASRFRRRIEPESGAEFPAAAGRYHLYVSFACPWAHRTLIFRAIKGLEEMISVSVVDPLMLDEGWTLAAGADPVNKARRLYEVYLAAMPTYSGRVTVPVLWDKQTRTIVNNESAEIIRMFNTAFDGLGARAGDYYPADLRADIDEINAFVYDRINNGVYKAGFATTQDAYEEAVVALFAAMDSLEERLAGREFLVGDRLTEADWRLFTTLARFDAVYHGHFKCNRRRLIDYPRLAALTRRLYEVPGVAGTVRFDHIKAHYYGSHRTINPTGVIAIGPDHDFRG